MMRGSEMQKLQGEIPSPSNPPSGCRFHTRCIYAESKCKAEETLWREIESDHFVQCHFADSFGAKRRFLASLVSDDVLVGCVPNLVVLRLSAICGVKVVNLDPNVLATHITGKGLSISLPGSFFLHLVL
ncbi:MAG: hypothetical protein R2865_06085 [Deinococcales bacterium]